MAIYRQNSLSMTFTVIIVVVCLPVLSTVLVGDKSQLTHPQTREDLTSLLSVVQVRFLSFEPSLAYSQPNIGL